MAKAGNLNETTPLSPPPSDGAAAPSLGSGPGYSACCCALRTRDAATRTTLGLLFVAICLKEAINISLPLALPAIRLHDVDGHGRDLVARYQPPRPALLTTRTALL